MGTRAMIGIWDSENGSVEATYVHYDGYIKGVGKALTSFFNTYESAAAVATVGYLSSLGEDLEASIEESVHKNEPTVHYDSVEQYMKSGYDYAGADYLYLWDGEAWFAASRNGDIRFTDVMTLLDETEKNAA